MTSDEPIETSTPTTPANKPSQTRRGRIRGIVATVAILCAAPIVAILLTAFVFQSYQVDGSSMNTTLSNNDRLIVWKMARTWARITGHPYIPKRGDVVIFVGGQQLTNYGQDANKQLIKRVIALPGERLQIKNGVITVYNSAHPNGFDPDKTLAYGKVIGDTEPMNTNGIITLGKNQIFVCGDNRPDSLDSRTFGPINVNQIVGQLAVRILPLNTAKRF